MTKLYIYTLKVSCEWGNSWILSLANYEHGIHKPKNLLASTKRLIWSQASFSLLISSSIIIASVKFPESDQPIVSIKEIGFSRFPLKNTSANLVSCKEKEWKKKHFHLRTASDPVLRATWAKTALPTWLAASIRSGRFSSLNEIR